MKPTQSSILQNDSHHHDVATAVREGLSKDRKALPSWMFYNETGDKLFQSIMQMPEYYPTRCEHEILQRYKDELLKYFGSYRTHFQLIELGAGDGRKTETLLKYFSEQRTHFTYVPVDISDNVLQQLADRLHETLPELDIQPQHKTYEQALEDLSFKSGKKVLLFMGANIGNFSISEATQFVKQLARHLHEDDLMMIGFDLKKDPRVIQKAYDDAQGITKDFNLNILDRLNSELGADFNKAQFVHFPYYDPETGEAKSYIVSLRDQHVHIEALELLVHFRAWETIHTEISQKYDLMMIEKMLTSAHLEILDFFFDSKQYFCDVVVTPQ